MIERILVWLAVAAACAAVVFGIVRGYEWWRHGQVQEGKILGRAEVQEKWDEDVRQRDAAKLTNMAIAFTAGKKQAADAAQGERDALKKSNSQAVADLAAARRTAAAVGGLSDHIAALDGSARAIGIPDAASCPAKFVDQRDAAVRARQLFGSCVAEYRSLGQAVDDSWRAVTLKLDTAMSYIGALAR